MRNLTVMRKRDCNCISYVRLIIRCCCRRSPFPARSCRSKSQVLRLLMVDIDDGMVRRVCCVVYATNDRNEKPSQSHQMGPQICFAFTLTRNSKIKHILKFYTSDWHGIVCGSFKAKSISMRNSFGLCIKAMKINAPAKRAPHLIFIFCVARLRLDKITFHIHYSD